MKPDAHRPPSAPAPPQGPTTVPRIDSRDLFTRGRRLEIRHGDTTYHLQITRQGKLILTK